MRRYNPKEIEQKWQEKWEKDGTYKVDFSDHTKPKYFGMSMLPGITGAGIHIGHGRTFQFSDIKVRAKRQQGYNAYNPIGWDSFGLPVENYAIKLDKKPREAHGEALAHFKEQLKRLGYSYDWSKEISTADPKYYKWTQWIFNKLYEHGLAYQKESPQWWCETDQTVLANEQVEAGKCWRCGNTVTKKNLKQWFFKITEYADEILEATDDLNWTEMVKTMQKNWIGKSKGAEVDFALDSEPNYVLLHGYAANPSSAFLPWLVNSLNPAKTVVPVFNHQQNTNISEQVNKLLGEATFDENTILMGHSLGSVVAMKALEQINSPIKKLVLVAGFAEKGFLDKKRPFEDTFDFQFDFEKIKSNVREIVILRDLNDSIVPSERAEFLRSKLGGKIVDIKANDDHFYGPEEPAVLAALKNDLKVFTTRPDTLFGATFMVVAPEHPLVSAITTDSQKKAVEDYIAQSQTKSEIERQDTDREKTGVFTGSYAINPVNNEKIPIWVADYVLYGYGTGAIMAVPAHDERDHAFAQKFDLKIVRVIQNDAPDDECTHDEGIMINSGEYNGLSSDEAREKILQYLETKGLANEKDQYKIRDWLISRQRYWGAPIPIIHCSVDGAVPVPDNQLPVILPEVDDYKPKGGATSVLATVDDWVNTKCPKCGGPAKRETDTMDGYACSSWYFLRYLDPFNDKEAWNPDQIKHWGPVDFYNGADHAVAHLLYARFWMRFFYKLGLVGEPEPFARMMYNAYILAPDGRKMSKSLGNVIDPMEIMDSGYGADSLRVYEMFIAPYDQDAPWDTQGVPGTYRFLNRVWNLTQEYIEGGEVELSPPAEKEILSVAHQVVKKVTEDIENDKFNTAVSSMMKAVNDFFKLKEVHGIGKSVAWDYAVKSLLQILSPFAPHITEELWTDLGNDKTIHIDNWPAWDEQYLVSATVVIVVQVNGKVRANLTLPANSDEPTVKDAALSDENVQKYLQNKEPARVVYVPGRLVNIVV